MIKYLLELFGGCIAICGAGVITWLMEITWWKCSYLCGWRDQMFIAAVLLGVWLMVWIL